MNPIDSIKEWVDGVGHSLPDPFFVVATQNPVEYVATGHLSEALRDRFEHLGLTYQSPAEEAVIVAAEAALADDHDPDPALVGAAVALVRASRDHARIRKGASVRGAIATVEIAVPPLASDNPALALPIEFFPGQIARWGLSFLINTEDVPGCRAANSLAWAGVHNTFFWIDPAEQLFAVFMSQGPGQREYFRTLVRDLVYAAVE